MPQFEYRANGSVMYIRDLPEIFEGVSKVQREAFMRVEYNVGAGCFRCIKAWIINANFGR